MEKNEIFERIKTERDYQDYMCDVNGLPKDPTVEGELIMLKNYIDKTLQIWAKKQSETNEVTLGEVRKIASIAIRCLENHGCPKRDLVRGVLNGE